MSRKKSGIPGISFSWKRATGVSAAKAKLSKQIGIPLTRSGRQRKFGAAAGCCVPFAFMVIGLAAAVGGAVVLSGEALAAVLR